MKLMASCVMAAAVAALAGCGQTATVESETPEPPVAAPEAPGFPVAPTDASAGPSGTDNKTWTFDQMGRTREGVSRPRLMYHNGGSDSWFMNIQCDAGTNNAYVLSMRDSLSAAPWSFTLQSGAARAQVTAAPVNEGEAGGGEIAVAAPVALDSPVMAAFRGTGALTQTEADGRSFVSDAINDDERATIAQFFAACA
jgi:hypothetical protein